jgi:hypothetical protein
MNKNLKYAKILILFVIIVTIINFIASIVYRIFNSSDNIILVNFARYFPYISNLGQLAFNLAILLIIIYFFKKDKLSKELYYSKILMIVNCIIGVIGILISIYLGINIALNIALENHNPFLLDIIGYFSYLGYISSIAFYVSIFLIIKYIIKVNK